jgi:ABC-type multidrug transport system ATPase subunit
VDILGAGPFRVETHKGRVGVLPQDAALDDRLHVREVLIYLGRLQGLSAGWAERDADQLLSELSLSDRAKARVGELSHGMRRRLCVATALLGDPELVLLDEPTAGLDPVQSHALRAILSARRGRATIVVSSHLLDELERICDWIVLIDRGRTVDAGTLDDVTARGREARWSLGPGVVPIDELRARLPGHRIEVLGKDDGQELVWTAPGPEAADPGSVVIAGALSAAGVPVRALVRGLRLEERVLRDAGRGKHG